MFADRMDNLKKQPLRLLGQLAACTLFLTLSACGSVTDEPTGGPAHHVKGGFRNTEIVDPSKSFFTFLRMRYFGDAKWADHKSRAGEVPVEMVNPEDLFPADDAPLQVTWLGHSTFLIQSGGVNILTDPVFSNRASPFSFTGPERYIPHVIDYAKLPRIDFVVISHNHYDHLDETAVEVLGNDPVYLVPLGLAPWFRSSGVEDHRVMEFDWWDKLGFGPFHFQATPSQHWSARGIFDRRETLWASWHMDLNGTRIWFAGDTGYNDRQFKEIGEQTAPIDLALIPIGAYAPRDFMKYYHVNPQEAVRIHQDIRAKSSVGMHWGTFPLTAEGPGDPVIELNRQISIQGLEAGEFTTMTVGETRLFPELGGSDTQISTGS